MIFLFALAALAQGVSKDIDRVEITVYNQNFGVVKETRTVDIKPGISTLAIENVASSIDATTVHFKSLDDPTGVRILEQNYQFDLLSPTAILEKSVGKKVRWHRTLPDGKKETVEGTLLTPPSQGIVVRANDGRLLLTPSGEVEVLELPEGLIPRPTLVWQLDADKGGRQKTEVSYMTDNINWQADYVVTVNKDDTMLDLDGWVTLSNTSGASYKDAKLKLVAGDVRRTPRYNVGIGGAPAGGGRMGAKSAPQFEESSLFEYHLYTLQRPTTIKNKEIKQVSLLTASGATAHKLLIYEGQRFYYMNYGPEARPGQGEDTDQNSKVAVYIEVKNSEANHLGMPLPKGTVRVYKQDNEGQLQFVGEDTIDHTPKDETVRLWLGNAFDVVATRKRTDFKTISPLIWEETIEINARNHKDSPQDLTIVEHPWGDWEMLSKSQEYAKRDAHTIDFPVTIPANGEVTVTYRVRMKW
jgi:hypothetical protein